MYNTILAQLEVIFLADYICKCIIKDKKYYINFLYLDIVFYIYIYVCIYLCYCQIKYIQNYHKNFILKVNMKLCQLIIYYYH